MTKEIINTINEKYEQNYQVSDNGGIYTIFMGKKQYYKLDEIVLRWENFEREINSRENSKIVSNYIESINGELIYSSVYGSHYYNLKGYKVRVSNHDWTSDYHMQPDINLCNYNKLGYTEMINELNELLHKNTN